MLFFILVRLDRMYKNRINRDFMSAIIIYVCTKSNECVMCEYENDLGLTLAVVCFALNINA